MTITLTTEELEKYVRNVQRWYDEFLQALLNNAQRDPMSDSLRVSGFGEFKDKWEKNHPKPMWKDLL